MTASMLLHNPRCSKSRAALALLQERGIAVEILPYLETPPTRGQLRDMVAMLGLGARDLLRTGEPEYAALGLADPTRDDEALIAAMAEHPRLIERPIFIHGNRAVIARPPERVLELLPD